MTPKLTRSKLALLFLLVWGGFLLPFALQGVLPGLPGGDTNRTFVPYRDYLLRTLWSGDLPELAPGMFGGHPLLSLGQTTLLYPTTLLGLLLRLPHFQFFCLDLWLHLALASFAFTLLLQQRGSSTINATVLGWVYANSSVVLFRATGHWTLLHQAALLPLFLFFWLRCDTATRGFRNYVGMAVTMALMILAQNPHWIFVSALLLFPLEVVRIFRVPPQWRMSHVRKLVAAGGIAVCLGAFVVVPMFCTYAISARADLRGSDLARAFPLSLWNLRTLLYPRLLFGEGPSTFFGEWYATESAIVVGRGPLILALCGLAFWATSRCAQGNGLPAVFVAGGLFLGTAPQMPWFRFLVKYLPLYGSLRAWGRVSIFVVIGLLCFAAQTVEHFRHEQVCRGRWLPAAVFATTAFVAMMIGFTLCTDPHSATRWMVHPDVRSVHRISRDLLQRFAIRAGFEVLWYGLWLSAGFCLLLASSRWRVAPLLVLLSAEGISHQQFMLRERARITTPRDFPQFDTAMRNAVRKSAPEPLTLVFSAPDQLNWGLYFPGVRSLSGSDPNAFGNYLRWLNEVQRMRLNSYQLETDIRRNLPAIRQATALAGEVYKDAAGQPALELIDSSIPFAELDFGTTQTSVQTHRWADNRFELLVNCPVRGTLKIRQFPDPNWSILSNGRRANWTSSGPTIAMQLPAGEHHIAARYRDNPARVGLAISLVSFFALGGAILITGRTSRWKRSPVQ